MKPEFYILGLDRLNRRIDHIANDMGPTLHTATRKATLYVHSTIPPYPAPPSGSRYRRTGNLGRRYFTDVRTIGSAIVGVIGNSAAYAPWVVSAERVTALNAGPQAGVHKGRWQTLQETVAKAKDAVIRIYSDAIKGLMG